MTQDEVDVVVVGGGAAGLSGALVLARSRRSVVVVDGGQPRNAPAAGMHGFLTRDGMPPAELVATGRREVEGYGGRVLEDGRVVPCQALVVGPRSRARTGLLTGLGLAPVEHAAGVGEHLAADPTGRTEVPGVWVAGNATDLMAQVGASAAAGALAGAAINGDLVLEDTVRAVGALQPAGAR